MSKTQQQILGQLRQAADAGAQARIQAHQLDGDWREALKHLLREGLVTRHPEAEPALAGLELGGWMLTPAGQVAAAQQHVHNLQARRQEAVNHLQAQMSLMAQAMERMDAPAEPRMSGMGGSQRWMLQRLAARPDTVASLSWLASGSVPSQARSSVSGLLKRGLVRYVSPAAGYGRGGYQITPLGQLAAAQILCQQAQNLVERYDQWLDTAQARLRQAQQTTR